MHRYGALTPGQIDDLLLNPETRPSALRYLAECSRLMAAVEPFVPPSRTSSEWVPRPDHVAHAVAAALGKPRACACL